MKCFAAKLARETQRETRGASACLESPLFESRIRYSSPCHLIHLLSRLRLASSLDGLPWSLFPVSCSPPRVSSPSDDGTAGGHRDS